MNTIKETIFGDAAFTSFAPGVGLFESIESVVVRTALDLRWDAIMIVLKGSVPTGNFDEPRLTSGAFEFLRNIDRATRQLHIDEQRGVGG